MTRPKLSITACKHQQGLPRRLASVTDLFHPAMLEAYKT